MPFEKMSLLEASLKDDIWNGTFKYISRVGRKLDYKRSVYRATQQYDPFVYEALKAFDVRNATTLLADTRGKTRVAGGDASLMNRIRGYDIPAYRISDKYRSAYTQALSELKRILNCKEKINPRWIYDVDIVPNTTSGYPLFQKKKDVKDKIYSEARFLFHLMKRKDFGDMGFPFTVPATRGASRPAEEEKSRLVWVYPAAMLISEGVFAQPLIDRLYKDNFSDIFLTGRDGLKKHQRIASVLTGADQVAVGADFEHFDTAPCRELIYDVFSVLNEKINHGTYEGKNGDIQTGGEGVKRRSIKAFQNVVEYFIHTPMILPNGRIIRKHVGVPSGSHFTNLIDSLYNWVMHKTWQIYYRLKLRELRVNGDDSAFIFDELTCSDQALLQQMSTFFLDCFGMVMNKAKTVLARTPGELTMSGTTWQNLVPSRTTSNWLELALNPKAYVRTPFEGFQRLLGIGVCGAFSDPMYCQFFRYYQCGWNCHVPQQTLNWDKYRWLEFVFGEVELPVMFKTGDTAFKLMVRFGN